MKKFSAFCFFVLFSISFCKAQMVTIPDTAFVNWLNNNGYAPAMNGNKMDVSNSLVQDADTLNIGYIGMRNIITNLYGIQFFPSVRVLICDFNIFLDVIPAFPPNLTYLEVQSNPFLDSIPSISSGVTYITVNNNNLLSIPNFPASARYIFCVGNQLTSLPSIPGNSLIELDCASNHITSLPALPSSLHFLECSSNNLTSLPALPNQLTQLDCQNMPGLTCFPFLPNSLEFMNYTGTGITCIPNIPVNTNSGNDYEPALTSLPLCDCASGCGVYAGISISASQTTICPGQKVTFTATPTNGGTNPQYQWVVNGVNTGNSSTVFNDSTLTDGSTVSCILTGNSTCADSTSAKSNTITISTGGQLPNLLVSPVTICKGNNGALNASGATTYAWLPATGLSATTGASITANPTVTTTYTVTGTNGCGTTTATAVITVNTLPLLSVSTPVSTCGSANQTLTASGATTYTWLPSTGLSKTTGASVTANPSFTTTYTVSGTNSCGTTTVSVVIVVSVGPPSGLITPSAVTLCNGASTTIAASSITAGTTYTWSPSTGLSSSTGASVTATPTVTTSYMLTATNACGIGKKAKTTITISASLAPTVTVNSPIICNGSGGTLTASGTSNTYSWLPAGALSSTTGASVTASPTVTTTYTVTGVITSTGCTATKTSIVTVNQQPTVSVNTLIICNGNNGTLTASGADTYSWSPSAGLSASTGTSVTANPTITTTYTVSGTNTCGSTTATTVVTVNPLPVVSVNNLAICSGLSDTLKASGADAYVWLPSTGLSVTTGASVIANPTITTTYTVSGTNSCGTTTAKAVVTVNPLPATAVSSITICNSSGGTITATGATTYAWLPSANLSATTGASVTASPAATTTYTVTGTNGCGTTTANAVVTVISTPTPAISPTVPSTCGTGSSVVITASSSAGGTTTYTWFPSTGLSATTGATVTANPVSGTFYTLTGTNLCGSSDRLFSVRVFAPPTITVNSPVICSGLSGTLTASGTGGANTFKWSPTNGLSASTGGSITANPTVTTTYTVTATTTSNGCSATKTSTVTVNPLPTISVNNLTICNGSSGTLTATGATTYSWSPSAGLSATTGASVTANPTVTTTYTVTGTNSCGTSTAISVVTVNPLPDVSVNNLTICSGSSGTLTASGADTSYTWSPATGLSATTGASVTANPTVTTTYTVTGTNSCGSSTAISVVTLNPLPAVSVNNLTICNGSSGTLTATGNDTSYTWSPSAGLSATTGTSVTANPTTTTTYTVSGTNSCGTTTAKAVVTVNPLPATTVSPITICNGSGGTLTASGATTYSWSPSTNLSATTGASVTASPTATTTYTVTGTNSCGSTTANATVTVISTPTVTVSPPGVTVCLGNNKTLTASGATTYTWMPASGLSATTGATVTFTPTLNALYTLTGINSCGTGTKSVRVTVNPLPAITVNSPATCSGLSTTLTASNTGGPSTFKWSPTNGLSASIGSPITANPTVTTTYTVTSTISVSGCSATNTSVVTVNPLPATVVNNLTICSGSSGTLTAGGATAYTWQPATGLSVTTGATVTANPTVTTTYTVTGTNTTTGCTASNISVVTVNPLPAVSVNNLTICNGASGTLTASGNDTSYTWSPSVGLSATTGASVTANPTVTTTYTVTGTNSCGTTTATSVVTVNPQPATAVNSLTICSGVGDTLKASGADTYTWSPASGLSATTGASVIANPTVTTTYTVTGTNTCGTTTAISVVTVNPLPAVSVNPLAICNGTSGTLTANGIAESYSWSPSAGLSATTGASVTANPTVTTTYTVTGTNSCGSSTAISVVTVTPVYTSAFSVPSSALCGTSTPATIIYTGNAPQGATYNWNFNGGTGFVTGSDTQSITWNTAGTYTVSLTVVNGLCPSALTTQNVVVNDMPSSTFMATSPICYGNASVINYTGTPVIPNATYTWNFDGASGGMVGATNQSLVFPASGTYTLTLDVTANGCPSTTGSQTIVVNKLPSVYVNDLTICSGERKAIAASGADTYTWAPATGLNPTTGFSVTASPAETTTYTITGTSICGTTMATAVITVNPQPYVLVNNLIMCDGQGGTLTASGSATYTWEPAAGLSTTTGASVFANPTTTTSYTVVGTNSCNATIAIAVVTVNKTATIVAKAGSAAGLEQLTANWNAAAGATGYMLDVSLKSNFSTFVAGYNNLSAGNVTSYVVTGLTASTTYYYRVRANDSCGTGPNSNTIAYATMSCAGITGGTITPATTVICPGATQQLTLGGLTGTNLQWQISTDNANWTNISTGGNATAYTTQASDGSGKKYYRCLSFTGCYNVSSSTAVVDVSQPLITISASNITENSFTLNWSPAGSGNYQVDYAGGTSGTLTSITPPLTLTGLSSGSAYSVTVTQTTPGGCAALGLVSGINTLCAPPTGLHVTGTASNSINLAWNGPVGNYRVYYMLLFTSQHVVKTKDVANATSAKIDSLLSGGSYQFYVASLNCGSTPGVVSGFVTGTANTKITACTAAPVIDSVRTTCSSQVQIWVHGSATNIYKIYLQPVAPVAQAVSSYAISGGNFSVNLISGQSYVIGAASVCGNGAIGSLTFWPQALLVPAMCGALNNLLISQPSCTGLSASWNPDNCATSRLSSYLLSVRKQGVINWTSYSVLPTTAFKAISGLSPGTTYQGFVRPAYSCTNYLVYGPASETQTATTPTNGCRIEDEQTVPEEKLAPAALTGNSEESFSLYPNPNTGEFMVDFSRLNPDEEQVRIELINVLGQTVLTHITAVADGHLNEFITLPAASAPGIYFVRLIAGDKIYNLQMNVSR